MTLNPKILAILEENKIDRDDALTYLIALYNKLNPSYIPDNLKRQVYANGILNRGETEGTVTWIVPLFQSPIGEEWSWVVDKYRVLFTQIRSDAGGDRKSCMEKMQLHFKNNPETTQDEVFAATNNYLDQFKTGKQSTQYLQRADYFILKTLRGAGGVTHESRLMQHIEIVRKLREIEKSRTKNLLR